MHLEVPLLKLPLRFDAPTLAAEVSNLPPEAWVPHPDRLPGNAAVRLVTPGGEMTDDVWGTMAPTGYLLSCPYIIETMAAIGAVWGRSRLMRLIAGAVVPPHIDTHFYWRKHVRIHVPVVTTPDVLFSCAGNTVHMAAGECWIFDTFSPHQVRNLGEEARVHLVIDTAGSERLFDLIAEARAAGAGSANAKARLISPGTTASPKLMLERAEVAGVMSPWELRCHIAFIGKSALPNPILAVIMHRLERFAAGWAGTWAQYATSADGASAYHGLIAGLEADLAAIGGHQARLYNNLPVYSQIRELLVNIVIPIAPPQAAEKVDNTEHRTAVNGAA